MTDERQNLPSASGIEAASLCAGKHALESTIPPADDSSEDSRSGDRIHAYMASATAIVDDFGLSDEEEQLAEKFKREERELVANLIGEPAREMREERLWMENVHAPVYTPLFSGKPDYVAIGEEAMLIVDYKSGWLGATVAPKNPQLRALVVLLAATVRPMGRPIFVATLLRSGPPTKARYERADLINAQAELYDILGRAGQPNAPRVPGEKQCRYCRARGVCPEANATVTTLAKMDTRELTTDELVRLLDVCGAAKKVIGSIEAKAKRMLAEDPASVRGGELGPGSDREKVTDVPALAGRYVEAGGTLEQFTPFVSITKTNVKAAWKAAIKQDGKPLKGRALDSAVKEAVAGLVETTPTAASLKRIA